MALTLLQPATVVEAPLEMFDEQRGSPSMAIDEVGRFQFLGFYDEAENEVPISPQETEPSAVGRYQFLGFR